MMKRLLRFRAIAYCAFALISASFAAQAQNPGATKEAARAAKVSTDLLTVINNGGVIQQAPSVDGLQRLNLFMTNGNSIAINAIATSEQEGQALLQALQGLGLSKGIVSKQQVTGYLPIDKLGDLKNIPMLRFTRPSYRPIHNVGSVTSQGDTSLRANVARTTYSVDGTGVKVGVLSDSYNNLNGAASGVATGDLPVGVEVLKDNDAAANGTGSDEGRAMMELVHDIAPGSPQAFYTAFDGILDFAAGIRALATAGCKIITDDVSYFAEPFFQDGPIAQAIDDVVTNMGVTYFSSAGNSARQSYQSAYSGTTPPASPTYYVGAHNFGGGDKFQSLTIGAGQQIIISFQWDDPFFSVSGGTGARTDMDLLVYVGGTFRQTLSSDNISIGGDPVEIISLTNNGSSAAVIELVLAKYEDLSTGVTPDPTLVKWVNFGSNVRTEYDTKSSTAVGHTNSSRCISVGAAPFYNTPAYNNALTTATIEPFSSAGGTPILFSIDGTRLGSPVVRQKPEITSVDGTNTTFFFSDSNRDADTFPNFFGTSAAAPHAAGVAALMKQKVPAITPAAILTAMENTALDMDDPFTAGFDTGFDYGTGYGFIQADRALQAISPVVTSLSLTASASPTMILTTGTTTLSATVSGGTTPYSYTFAGPGTINQSGNTATVSGLPAGVQTFTVTAKDATTPTSQSVTATVSVTVTTAPPANTPPTVANVIPTQSATVGQAFTYMIPANTFTDAETPNQLTLSVSGLPPGLMFTAPATISGTPSMSGVTIANVTATDPGNLSASTGFTIAIYPATVIPPDPTGTFSITGVTTVSCLTVTATRRELTFTPQYAGVNGQPISFSVVNEKLPTTDPGPYTIGVYIDKPAITLKATQTGSPNEASFIYDWLAVCGMAPVTPEPTGNLVIASVTPVSCLTVAGDPNRRSVTFNPQYSGSNGQPISFSVVNEKLPTTDPGPYTIGLYTDKPTITLKATQNGSPEASFVYNWLATCGTTTPTPEPTGTFAITGVTTVSCIQVNATRRSLTFTPQYAGTNGQPISFSVVNEYLPTTAPGPYTLGVYIDKATITLSAKQTGSPNEATFVYNWLAACNTSSARVGAEPGSGLQVRLLGNPVEGGRVSVQVGGIAGQSLKLSLTNERGQVIGSHQVDTAGSEERHVFDVSSQPQGLLLLKASTAAESKTLKVIKSE